MGSDGCAVVLETGEGCTKLQKGDYVFSCMLIGQNKYTPFQETYLVREDLVLKKNTAVSVEQACTIGVGLLVSAFFRDSTNKSEERNANRSRLPDWPSLSAWILPCRPQGPQPNGRIPGLLSWVAAATWASMPARFVNQASAV